MLFHPNRKKKQKRHRGRIPGGDAEQGAEKFQGQDAGVCHLSHPGADGASRPGDQGRSYIGPHGLQPEAGVRGEYGQLPFSTRRREGHRE